MPRNIIVPRSDFIIYSYIFADDSYCVCLYVYKVSEPIFPAKLKTEWHFTLGKSNHERSWSWLNVKSQKAILDYFSL